MPKTLQGDNIMGCQHGRPQGSPCPHCLGINNPEDNQPQPQESIEERLEEDFPTLWRVMEETEIFGIKMSVRFLVWLKIRFEEALQSQQSLHEAELARVRAKIRAYGRLFYSSPNVDTVKFREVDIEDLIK